MLKYRLGPGWYHPEYITIDAVENKNSLNLLFKIL